MKKITFNYEQRIVHALMMKALSSKDIGLFNGKIGVAIALFHYHRTTGVSAYESYSYALLDSVLNNVTRNLDFSLSSGLSGIGWGIEYLLQNGFVDGEANEICEQIDKQIMSYDPRRIVDYSLDKGLDGLMHYILIHCKNHMAFDPQYIAEIESVISRRDNCQFSIYQQALQYKADISKFALPIQIETETEEFHNIPIGINCGLAGLLIQKCIL